MHREVKKSIGAAHAQMGPALAATIHSGDINGPGDPHQVASSPLGESFDGDRFGEVARLIDVGTFEQSHMIGN